MKSPIVYGLFALSLAVLAGCSLFTNDEILDPLKDTEWKLVTIIRSGHETEPPPDQEYRIHFMEDGFISAQVDCNWQGGTYRIGKGNTIDIDFDVSTAVGCGPTSLYGDFSVWLHDTDRYEVRDEKELILHQGLNHSLILSHTVSAR